MPQLETAHLIYDLFILTSVSFIGFLCICYSTCTAAISYYNSINKYITNVHGALYYFIKTQHDIIFEKFCLTKFFNSSMVKVADIYYILREKRYIYYINYRFHES